MAAEGLNPLRILFVSGTPLGTATCRYRCEHLAEALREGGAQADVVYIGQPRVRVAHDIVVLYRVCATAEGRRFARAARACGATLVYSTDDIVFDAEAAPPQMGKRFRALAPLHREMLAEADGALASTEYLAGLMRAAVPDTPVYTLRNFLGRELAALFTAAQQDSAPPSEGERVTLGYLSGSPTHDEDFAAAADPLAQILRENAKAELLIVGPLRLPKSLDEWEARGRVRRLESVGWRTLPELMLRQGITINLAPLDLSRRFCHAKSEVKYLEAGALGIPTIASASKGFQEAISSEKGEAGCILAEGNADWVGALNLLVQHKSECERLGARAFEYVNSVGTTQRNVVMVNSVFLGLAGRGGIDSVPAVSETMVNWPFSPRYALKGVLEQGAALAEALSVHRRKGTQAK